MRRFVQSYVSTCDVCARNKPSRHAPHGELATLQIPSSPWKSLVTLFPISRGFSAMLTVVDRFTKMTHFIPCTHHYRHLGFCKFVPRTCHPAPRHPRFPRLWSRLDFHLPLLAIPRAGPCIHRRLSTAFHPQTDGQTERMNQLVEQYLGIYCNYQQDNWSHLLPVAEFLSSVTQVFHLLCEVGLPSYVLNRRPKIIPHCSCRQDFCWFPQRHPRPASR